MKIATWNVNSLRARLELMQRWIPQDQPDIILLQETKVIDSLFPHSFLEDLGYNSIYYGQKTYNGVAILSKTPLEDIRYGFEGEKEGEARYIEAFTENIRVVSVYVPNGQIPNSPQYFYKLNFLKHLEQRLANLLKYEELLIVGGDYNIAPFDSDIYDPKAWEGSVLCTPAERQCFENIVNLGFTDVLKTHQGESDSKEIYTWWDYRAGRWPKNQGLRIDHLLASPLAAKKVKCTGVDRHVRGWPKTSDHAPVWCQL